MRKIPSDSPAHSGSQCTIDTPLGPLTLEETGGVLTRIRFALPELSREIPGNEPLHLAAIQIGEYLSGARRAFDLTLRPPPTATEFQRRVWDLLSSIPYGETRTYGHLARQLGTSPRAVGGACARNPLPLLVPCHRVVARHGLGGYAGDWETGLALRIKERLLTLEASVVQAGG